MKKKPTPVLGLTRQDWQNLAMEQKDEHGMTAWDILIEILDLKPASMRARANAHMN